MRLSEPPTGCAFAATVCFMRLLPGAPARPGEIIGEVALVGGRPVDIVEVSVDRNALVERAPQLHRGWRALESKLNRAWRRRGDRDQEVVAGCVLRADQQRR